MIRKYLRKRVQKVLSDNPKLKQVISKVVCRRSVASDDNELPIILVYNNQEPSERFDEAPKSYKKFSEFVIEIITSHDTEEELCDELDDLCELVEEAIESDPILRGFEPFTKNGDKFEDIIHSNIEFDDQGEGSSPIGAARMTFTSMYIKDAFNRIAIKDFIGVDIEWNIGNHGDNKATDSVELPIV